MVSLTKTNCLPAKDRKRINKQLHIFTTNKHFDEIPLEGVFSILQNEGLQIIMEDYREWQGFLCGESADVNFVLADKTRPRIHEDYDRSEPDEQRYIYVTYEEIIKNVELRFTWYKFTSGRYEIVAYLT